MAPRRRFRRGKFGLVPFGTEKVMMRLDRPLGFNRWRRGGAGNRHAARRRFFLAARR